MILLGRMDRYVGAAVRESWVVCFGTFLSLFVLFDMVMNVGQYARNAGTLGHHGLDFVLLLLQFYAYLTPTLVVSFAPFVTVIAAMFAVTKLMAANEVVPMVFSSRSVTRVLWPAFRVALLSTALVGATWEWVVPVVAEPLETMHRALDQGRPRGHESDLLARTDDGAILFCKRYLHAQRRMEDITVLERDRGRDVTAVVRAEAAEWQPEGFWRLLDGQRREGNVIAPVTELRLSEVEPDLLWRISRGQKDGSQLSYSELIDLQNLRPGRYDFTLNFWVHVTFPLANLVLLLLALPLAVHFERGSRTARVVQAIAVCGAYFVFDLACRNLGLRQFINPVAAAWLPTIAFGALGAVLWSNMRT